jgi:hypothetical protein
MAFPKLKKDNYKKKKQNKNQKKLVRYYGHSDYMVDFQLRCTHISAFSEKMELSDIWPK